MLYIAEKPELARAITEALGGGRKRNSHYECGRDKVTWCFGHMLELCEPEDYDPAHKKWTLDALPLIFVPWRKKPIRKSKEQLDAILGLLKSTDAVAHAGDPDAEGQLLVDEILAFAKFRGRVVRVLINDLTPALVKKAIASPRDNAEFKGLSAAAEARQVGDMIFGFNLTRLYTLAGRREGFTGVLSVGRVQTPILGLIVRRDREHGNHQKTEYYIVRGQFRFGESSFAATYQNRDDDPLDEKGRLRDGGYAQALAASLSGKNASIGAVERVRSETPPPLPYNLLALQVDAARAHGLKPDAVKEITQALREKHRLITYNRSDSRYLSDIQHVDAPAVIAAVMANAPAFAPLAVSANPEIKSRAFDSAKVTAHHAIIPTQSRLDGKELSPDEMKIYFLIARAYLAQFLPNHQYEKTTVAVLVEDRRFIAASRVALSPGWKIAYGEEEPNDSDGDEEQEDTVFPDLATGDSGVCAEVTATKKETTPKPLYNMAGLLEDLTRVAQYVKDPALRKSLVDKDKDKAGEHGGIGTPATRDTIINTLFTRGFIETRKKGKQEIIVSTQAGRDFHGALPESATVPDMTAVWHEQQRAIEKGDMTVNAFVQGLAGFIGAETARVKEAGLGLKLEMFPCPACGAAMLRRKGEKGFFWSCSTYPVCRKTCPDEKGRPNVSAQTRKDKK